MNDTDLGDRLLTQLRAISLPLNADHERELRDAVCEYVDALKAQGYAPERMVVKIKYMAAEAGLRTSMGRWTGAAGLSDNDAFLNRMVAWCIERYFARNQTTET